jgi:SHOCT-like domain
MSEERKKVLAMLAEGKITAEEAERLLDKLGQSGEEGERGHRHRWGMRGHRRRKHLHIGAAALPNGGTDTDDDDDSAGDEPSDSAKPLKYLRVEIHSNGDDHVSVRVPLRLIRTGVKLTTMLPSETSAKLADKGIDLTELGKLEGDELVDALRDLKVDVDSADGDTVRVFCE